VVTWNIGGLAAGASSSVQLRVGGGESLANGTVLTKRHLQHRQQRRRDRTAGAADHDDGELGAGADNLETDAPRPGVAGNNITYTLSYSNSGNATRRGGDRRHGAGEHELRAATEAGRWRRVW